MKTSVSVSFSIGSSNHSTYVHQDIEVKYLKKPLLERVWNIVRAIFNGIVFFFSMIPRAFSYSNQNSSIPQNSGNVWKEDNKGLFVIIHGLYDSTRFAGGTYFEQIKNDRQEYEVRLPKITSKGNCSLEKAAEPVLSMILDYISENPGKPINLIGHSNGGRIAVYIEEKLRGKNVSIRVTGVAGVFFGSSAMDFLSKNTMTSYVLDQELITELKVASEEGKRIALAMGQEPLLGKRYYELYATPNDQCIPNFSSCFPKVSNAKYHLVPGYGHASLWTAIRDKELKRAYEWMDAQQEVVV